MTGILAATSRPARARGLKRICGDNNQVAGESRPARARGLKRDTADRLGGVRRSRPARARGLKHQQCAAIADVICRAPRGRVD